MKREYTTNPFDLISTV